MNMTKQRLAAGEKMYAFCKARVNKSLPEGVELGARQLAFTVSTAHVDRDNDVLYPQGCRYANYMANPVVLGVHDDENLPVARCDKLIVREFDIIALDTFGDEETQGEWGKVSNSYYLSYLNGFMSATSVGFDPLDWLYNEMRRGFDILEWEKLEHSCVPIPANAYALEINKNAEFMKDIKLAWEKFMDERTDDANPLVAPVESAILSATPKQFPVNQPKEGGPVALRLTRKSTRILSIPTQEEE